MEASRISRPSVSSPGQYHQAVTGSPDNRHKDRRSRRKSGLAKKQELLRFDKRACFQSIKVHSAWYSRCVEFHLVNSRIPSSFTNIETSRRSRSYTLNLTSDDLGNSYLMVVVGLNESGQFSCNALRNETTLLFCQPAAISVSVSQRAIEMPLLVLRSVSS
jgi:hypothetical protein